MKAKAIIAAAILAAATQAAAGGSCDDYFRIRNIDQDRDGNTTYSVTLTDHARENPTDSVIAELGRCYAALLSTSPGMGAIEDDQGRYIEINDALEMSDY